MAARRRSLAPRDRLIVALDVPSVDAAQRIVAQLGDAVSFYKIGYQLAFAGGLSYAPVLADSGKRVFLDLKLHDIGNTVKQGVKSVARLGASFLTVHAYPHGIRQQTHLALGVVGERISANPTERAGTASQDAPLRHVFPYSVPESRCKQGCRSYSRGNQRVVAAARGTKDSRCRL